MNEIIKWILPTAIPIIIAILFVYWVFVSSQPRVDSMRSLCEYFCIGEALPIGEDMEYGFATTDKCFCTSCEGEFNYKGVTYRYNCQSKEYTFEVAE